MSVLFTFIIKIDAIRIHTGIIRLSKRYYIVFYIVFLLNNKFVILMLMRNKHTGKNLDGKAFYSVKSMRFFSIPFEKY
jgi:hypothetical protein